MFDFKFAYFIFSFLLLQQNVFALATNKVITVKGNATILRSPKIQAEKITQGQSIQSGDSILTEKGSIVKIKFTDGATLTISPNSKLEIKDTPSQSKVTVISLLKGLVRSKVKKDGSLPQKTKYKVLTRTASLGVRGTDFIATYNPINKVSTNLTLTGLVEIAKDNKKSKFAGFADLVSTDDQQKEPMQPIRIAPDQLAYLRLGDQAKNKKVLKKEYSKVLSEYAQKPIKETNLPAGGYLDFKTGLYVIPEQSKLIYDEKLKLFRPKEIGAMVDENGNFKPEPGKVVDPLYGYVKESELEDLRKNKKPQGLKFLYTKYKEIKESIKRNTNDNYLRVSP